MLDFVLEQLTVYGAPVFGLALLIAAAGLPSPATPLIIAAGALVRQGVLPLETTVIMGLAGIVLGDLISYSIGRFAGERVERHLSRQREELFNKARSQFQRYGAWAVFFTHFIFVSLDVPINLIAGSSGYPFPRFLLLVFSSRASWLFLHGALGYIVGSQWEAINELVSRYTLWLGLIVLACIAFYLLIRYYRRRKRSEPV